MKSVFCEVTSPASDIRCVFGVQGCTFDHGQPPFALAHQYECKPNNLLSCMCSRGTPGCPLEHHPMPIPMIIYCPDCGKKHIDEGEWATKEHKTHLCRRCKASFRPANVPTVGVEQLPEAR